MRFWQHGAPDRDECDLCGRTQVDNGGPHIYGHCANPGSDRSAGPGASAPTNATRKHGDAGLWAHTIWMTQYLTLRDCVRLQNDTDTVTESQS